MNCNTSVIQNLLRKLDDANAIASALEDNCWADGQPLPPDASKAIRQRLCAIHERVTIAERWARSEARPAAPPSWVPLDLIRRPRNPWRSFATLLALLLMISPFVRNECSTNAGSRNLAGQTGLRR